MEGIGNHNPETWSSTEPHKISMGQVCQLAGKQRIVTYHQTYWNEMQILFNDVEMEDRKIIMDRPYRNVGFYI